MLVKNFFSSKTLRQPCFAVVLAMGLAGPVSAALIITNGFT